MAEPKLYPLGNFLCEKIEFNYPQVFGSTQLTFTTMTASEDTQFLEMTASEMRAKWNRPGYLFEELRRDPVSFFSVMPLDITGMVSNFCPPTIFGGWNIIDYGAASQIIEVMNLATCLTKKHKFPRVNGHPFYNPMIMNTFVCNGELFALCNGGVNSNNANILCQVNNTQTLGFKSVMQRFGNTDVHELRCVDAYHNDCIAALAGTRLYFYTGGSHNVVELPDRFGKGDYHPNNFACMNNDKLLIADAYNQDSENTKSISVYDPNYGSLHTIHVKSVLADIERVCGFTQNLALVYSDDRHDRDEMKYVSLLDIRTNSTICLMTDGMLCYQNLCQISEYIIAIGERVIDIRNPDVGGYIQSVHVGDHKVPSSARYLFGWK